MGAAGALTVHRLGSAESLGSSAAELAAQAIRRALRTTARARVLLAAAPSQAATLTALSAQDLPFERVDFFHMDDYLGLGPDAPQRFSAWLDVHFFRLLPRDVSFCRMDTAGDPDRAAAEYAERIGPADFDVTLCGLGVNAHLAFNDPPANFHDPLAVRTVELAEASRRQQVDEGHFRSLAEVPTRAITVTVPRLLAAGTVVCSVPGAAKRDAVARTLLHAVDPNVPGTALRLHGNAHLFVDHDSSPEPVDHA